MNILDAIQAMEDGKYILYTNEKGDPRYAGLQTTLLPFGTTEIVKIDLCNESERHALPEKFSDLDFDINPDVCMKAIKSDNFRLTTEAEIMEIIKKKWYDANSSDDDTEENDG